MGDLVDPIRLQVVLHQRTSVLHCRCYGRRDGLSPLQSDAYLVRWSMTPTNESGCCRSPRERRNEIATNWVKLP